MMFSLCSLQPIARSMKDHFGCFENVSQLSMALETLYLDPIQFRSSQRTISACIAGAPFKVEVAVGSAVHGGSGSSLRIVYSAKAGQADVGS
jgi:hypothetical protein